MSEGMQTNLILALLFDAVLLSVCGFAVRYGGRPERLGAAINLIAAGLTISLRYMGIASGAPAEAVILLIDFSVVAAFYWLAIKTCRFWPIWAFGFALANIFTSAAGRMMPDAPLFAYHTGMGIFAYLALAALGTGTAKLPRSASDELKRGGRTPWRQPQNGI
jgi:hypothetical protein